MPESKTTNILSNHQVEAIARRMSDNEAANSADIDKYWTLSRERHLGNAEKVLKTMVTLGFKFDASPEDGRHAQA